jgi:hypothetical protein
MPLHSINNINNTNNTNANINANINANTNTNINTHANINTNVNANTLTLDIIDNNIKKAYSELYYNQLHSIQCNRPLQNISLFTTYSTYFNDVSEKTHHSQTNNLHS